MANYNEKYFGGEPPKEYDMEKLISANEANSLARKAQPQGAEFWRRCSK